MAIIRHGCVELALTDERADGDRGGHLTARSLEENDDVPVSQVRGRDDFCEMTGVASVDMPSNAMIAG